MNVYKSVINHSLQRKVIKKSMLKYVYPHNIDADEYIGFKFS